MDDVAHLTTALAGRYDIEREVGAGGMATVYSARDLKHNRRVALKVLRPDLGAVLGVERFLSEIEVTANLQHPNLLPLFDSGEAGGLLFYVMPFMEGESLRAKLDREKQLPIDDAIRIATAVASALDYAHRRGVIHRDLKPENILLQEGQPLVADFGIALAVSNAGGGRITQTGLSLGTPQYMSPEQATGDRAIDARTDIYSLGALTYEMLTGEPPHIGSTSQAVIARVLTERPRSIRSSRPNVPEHVEAAVERALEKLPADRFATAHEFADAISGKAIVTRSATAAHASSVAAGGRTLRVSRNVVAAAGLLWIASLVTVALLRPSDAPVADEVRFEFETQTGQSAVFAFAPPVSVSPDGRLLAYLSQAPIGGQRTLWVRPLNSTVARAVGTLDATNAAAPFWSPDSRSIAYASTLRLMVASVDGGTPREIADAPVYAGGTWNADNEIVFGTAGRLMRVRAAGGVATPVEVRDGDSTIALRGAHPRFLPDGKRFLFLDARAASTSRGINVASLDGGAVTHVSDVNSNVAFTPPGYLVWNREGSLFAQRFDTKALRLTGEPVRIAENVATSAALSIASFEISTNGVLIYRPATAAADSNRLEWYSRSGAMTGRVGEPGPFSTLRMFADGKRAALLRSDARVAKTDVWTADLTSGIANRLTFDTTRVADPVWTHDGRAIVYASGSGATRVFRKKEVGGSRDTIVLTGVTGIDWPDDVSSDGTTLLYHRTNSLHTVALAPGTQAASARTLVDTPFAKDEPRFSPDGKWISYGSVETGTWEIYVASYPAFDNIQRVSAKGGAQAAWRGDSRELFYLAPDGKVMSVELRSSGGRTEFLTPVALFQSPIAVPTVNVSLWGVARDGQRFLFIVSNGRERVIAPAVVVVNWMNGLSR